MAGEVGGGGGSGTLGGGGFFERCFLKRLRFLTKRSIREVGKPVSTTREPPRFGDWRSATIWEIRGTRFFFHGNGMVVLREQ